MTFARFGPLSWCMFVLSGLVSWEGPVLAQPTDIQQISPEDQKALAASLGQDGAALATEPTPASTVATGAAGDMPNLSLILDTAGAWFSQAKPLQLGGHDPTANGFNLQQLELHLDTNIDPYFRVDANLVFGPGGFELEEAYGSTLALPHRLKVRAGKFLSNFGRMNPTHPHAWHFVDQPLALSQMLGPDGSRGLGTELSWLAPLPWSLELLASVQQADEAPTVNQPWPARRLQDLRSTVALKQFVVLSENWGLLLGFSGQRAPIAADGAGQSSLAGADLHLRYRPVADADRSALEIQGEYFVRQRNYASQDVRDHSGYAHVVYNLNAQWEMGVRAEQAVYHADPLQPTWQGLRRRYVGQVTWFPSHFSRLRLQAGVDDTQWQGHGLCAMLALELVGGAHGAHSY